MTSLCPNCGMGRNHFVTDAWQVDYEFFNTNSKEGHGKGENTKILHETMLSQLDLPTPIDIISSYVQEIMDTSSETVLNRNDMDIEDSVGDSLYDSLPVMVQRRQNPLGTSLTEEIEQLARTESRPRTNDNAFIPIGVNLWDDEMEHMREISEFAHGGS